MTRRNIQKRTSYDRYQSILEFICNLFDEQGIQKDVISKPIIYEGLKQTQMITDSCDVNGMLSY
jgi:hypothetical protein